MRKPRLSHALISGAIALLTFNANAAALLTLPNGFDLHNTTLAGIDKYTIDGNAPFINSGFHLSGNNADSAWFGPVSSGGSDVNKSYDLETAIDLTGMDPAGLSLTGFWVSDNEGVEIFLNGNATGHTNPGRHGDLPEAHPENAFELDGFAAGINSVVFRWGNEPDFGGIDPTSIRVQFESYAIVPVPAAVWLMASSLLGIINWRGRSRLRVSADPERT